MNMWITSSAQAKKQGEYNLALYREARSLFREIERDLQVHHMLRNDQIYVKSDSPHEKCITLIFADSLRLYGAALKLFKGGYLEPAVILTRSLFERLVDALYISKESKTRVRPPSVPRMAAVPRPFHTGESPARKCPIGDRPISQ